jgi:hypothetical protein
LRPFDHGALWSFLCPIYDSLMDCFFCLMFHVMWNETWINGMFTKTKEFLYSNWIIIGTCSNEKKIEQVIGLSLSVALFRDISWVTKYNGSFKIACFSQCVDFWWAQFHFRLASSSNNSISHQPNHILINSFFLFLFFLMLFIFNFLKLDLIFP